MRKMTRPPKERTSVAFPVPLRKKLEREVRETGESMTNIVTYALKAYFQNKV